MDWRIRTNAETPAIKALYDLMSTIPGGSVRLTRLKMISVDFLAKGNRLVRTHPYHLQRVTASVRIRPVSLVDGDGTNLGTLNDTIASFILVGVGGSGDRYARGGGELEFTTRTELLRVREGSGWMGGDSKERPSRGRQVSL